MRPKFLFPSTFYRGLVYILSASIVATVAHPQENKTSTSETERYESCERSLRSPPMTDLSRLVKEGLGSEIRSGYLGDSLHGLNCSDGQLRSYMEGHGFTYRLIEERKRMEENHEGKYNRRALFCVMSKRLIDRLRGGRCSVVAIFYMHDDKVSFIKSSGVK